MVCAKAAGSVPQSKYTIPAPCVAARFAVVWNRTRRNGIPPLHSVKNATQQLTGANHAVRSRVGAPGAWKHARPVRGGLCRNLLLKRNKTLCFYSILRKAQPNYVWERLPVRF